MNPDLQPGGRLSPKAAPYPGPSCVLPGGGATHHGKTRFMAPSRVRILNDPPFHKPRRLLR